MNVVGAGQGAPLLQASALVTLVMALQLQSALSIHLLHLHPCLDHLEVVAVVDAEQHNVPRGKVGTLRQVHVNAKTALMDLAVMHARMMQHVQRISLQLLVKMCLLPVVQREFIVLQQSTKLTGVSSTKTPG